MHRAWTCAQVTEAQKELNEDGIGLNRISNVCKYPSCYRVIIWLLPCGLTDKLNVHVRVCMCVSERGPFSFLSEGAQWGWLLAYFQRSGVRAVPAQWPSRRQSAGVRGQNMHRALYSTTRVMYTRTCMHASTNQHWTHVVKKSVFAHAK